MRILILLIAVVAMVPLSACPKGSLKVSSPIQFQSSGPSQIGAYVNQDWGSPLPPVQGDDIIVISSGPGHRIDLAKVWANNPSKIRRVQGQQIELDVYPDSMASGFRVVAAESSDPTFENARKVDMVYMGPTDFGTSGDPKLVARFIITLPSVSKAMILDEKGDYSSEPWRNVYLIEVS